MANLGAKATAELERDRYTRIYTLGPIDYCKPDEYTL